VDRVAAYQDKTWCLAEIDIFCDLSAAEMDAIDWHHHRAADLPRCSR
jgi:hypothetical protein